MNKKIIVLMISLFSISCFAAEVLVSSAFDQLLKDAIKDGLDTTAGKQLKDAAKAMYFVLTADEQVDARNDEDFEKVFAKELKDGKLVRFTKDIDEAIAAVGDSKDARSQKEKAKAAAELIAKQYAKNVPGVPEGLAAGSK